MGRGSLSLQDCMTSRSAVVSSVVVGVVEPVAPVQVKVGALVAEVGIGLGVAVL